MVLSMRGRHVDMVKLAAENADKLALGNASMNARGDMVGPGGSVVKTHEQVAREYHANNPKGVKQVALRDIKREVFVSPADAVAAVDPKLDAKQKKRKLAE